MGIRQEVIVAIEVVKFESSRFENLDLALRMVPIPLQIYIAYI